LSAQTEFAPIVTSIDALRRSQARNANLIDVLRQIARAADSALDLRMHDLARADVQQLRTLALDAIARNKDPV